MAKVYEGPPAYPPTTLLRTHVKTIKMSHILSHIVTVKTQLKYELQTVHLSSKLRLGLGLCVSHCFVCAIASNIVYTLGLWHAQLSTVGR